MVNTYYGSFLYVGISLLINGGAQCQWMDQADKDKNNTYFNGEETFINTNTYLVDPAESQQNNGPWLNQTHISRVF